MTKFGADWFIFVDARAWKKCKQMAELRLDGQIEAQTRTDSEDHNNSIWALSD